MTEKRMTESRVNICTLGHFGHGKTMLLAAMTKVLAKIGTVKAPNYDLLKEPQVQWESEIPIALARVDYETSGRHYSHFDCATHIDYIKHIIVGAPIHGAILVVSVLDGVMPEAEEQVQLAQKLDIPIHAVFLNKIDKVKDDELVELNEMEIQELLNTCGFNGNATPIIGGSALKAWEYSGDNLNYAYWQPILDLTMELNARAAILQQETESLLMAIEEVFDIEGKGKAVTGIMIRGDIAISNRLEIVGLQEPISTRCIGTIEDIDALLRDESSEEEDIPQTQQEEQQKRMGFLLKDMEEKLVAKGQVLAAPKSITAHIYFEAAVYHLTLDEGGIHAPLVVNDRIQCDFWTADVTGHVTLPEHIGMIAPGQNGIITIELEQPMAMERGTRFTLKREGGKMGVGVVTDIFVES